jgi:hypothetical protein
MDELWRHHLHAWGEFYVIVGGGAAALTGLLFVVISIAPHMVSARSVKNTRAFVTPTITYFATALTVAGFMTMPSMSPDTLAALLTLGGIAGLAYMVWIGAHRQWREAKLDLEDWVCFVGLPIVGYLAVLAAAVEIWLDSRFGLETVAVAMLLFLLIGIRNAWDLVLFMAQQPRT